MRTCIHCKITKDFNEFYIHYFNKLNEPIYRSYCKTCNGNYRIKWRKNNKEKAQAISKKTYQKFKYKNRSYHLKRKFNITEDEYNNLLKQQNNSCAICGRQKNYKKNVKYFDIDHCHKTNKVRGLLCNLCNTGLGCYQDNIQLLQNAINYLKDN